MEPSVSIILGTRLLDEHFDAADYFENANLMPDRSTSRAIAAAVLLVTMLPSCAFGQADEMAFKKLGDLFVPSHSSPVELLAPGYLLDPAFSLTDDKEQEQYTAFYNRMLIPSLIYSPTQTDLGDLYSKILTDSEWALVPLTSSQRQELARLNQLLFKDTVGSPTTGYARYLEKKKAYEAIRQRFESTPESQRTAELENDLRAASDDLDLAGHKATFQPAESRLNLLNQTKSLDWRSADLHKFQQSVASGQNGTTWAMTLLHPDLSDLDNSQWVSLTITSDDLQDQASAPSLSHASQPVDWWSWTLASPSNASCAPHFPNSSFVMHLEYQILSVARDWLDQRVFDFLALRRKQPERLISNGQLDGNTGTAPLFITSVIVVRNLAITGPLIGVCGATIRHELQLHHEIGFGPFKLAGDSMGTVFYLPALLYENSVMVPYTQIVGVEAFLLPVTPNPNPDFQWPIQ